jgi:Flp pilus assembly protein TadD
MDNEAARQATFARALELKTRGELREALALFEDCVAMAPLDAQAHAQAGAICADLEDWARSVGHFRVTVAAAPHVPEAWIDLSVALRRSGHLDGAEATARRPRP